LRATEALEKRLLKEEFIQSDCQQKKILKKVERKLKSDDRKSLKKPKKFKPNNF